tara:strand:+ start:8289 stop:9017 length:729 start_codon:yes stop_codon:yes gene_type:complete
MSELTDDINNKKRNVEINVYYEKKYNSYLDVLKYFTLYIVGLLILAILRKRYYLSRGLTNILTFCLVIIGSMHIYVQIADINARNNMNFDEYDWTFDPSEQSDPNKLDNRLMSDNGGTGLACVESECCDTNLHKWCPTTGKCVSNGNYSTEACEDQKQGNGNPYFTFSSHEVGTHGQPSTTDTSSDNNTHITDDHFVGKYVLDLKKNFSDVTNSIFNTNVYSNNEPTNIKSVCQYDRSFATV